MNTPSHAILNLSLLVHARPDAIAPVIGGAILPDVPMLVMYVWARKIRRQSEHQVWSETYWHPFWQQVNHTFHSMPLAAIGATLCYLLDWPALALLFFSALLHCLGDFPLHNHDAHRHFLPFSNYRFISPISYWDPRYHGRVVAQVEKVAVLLATLYLLPQVDSWFIRGLMVAVNLTYFSGLFYRWVFQGCIRTQALHSRQQLREEEEMAL